MLQLKVIQYDPFHDLYSLNQINKDLENAKQVLMVQRPEKNRVRVAVLMLIDTVQEAINNGTAFNKED